MPEPQSTPPPRETILSGLVHDLSPLLASIEEHLDCVVGELSPEHEARPMAEVALAQMHDVRSLVADVLLLVSSADARRPGLFDPVEEVRRVVQLHASRLGPTDLVLNVRVPGPVRLRGPRTLLARAVLNLLQNAARYARTRVEVSLASEGAELLLAVEDDGAGVEPEVRERLFEPGAFGTGGGHGLGLAVVRWVAETLGGRVELAEAGALGGARFEVRLPLGAPASSAPHPSRIAGRTVAVVDDEPVLRDVMGRLLRGSGGVAVEIAAEHAPLEAVVSQILDARPDLVLLDSELGRWSGAQVLRRLRALAPEVAARVVYLSGAPFGADREIPHILKGIPIPDLLEAIEAALARAEVARVGG